MVNDADLSWMEMPQDAKAASNLDQAELNAWKNGQGSIEDSVSDERCSNELIDEASDYGDTDAIEATDLQADELVGEAVVQAERRILDLGNFYPFKLSSAALVHDDDHKHWAYRFCLLASLANEFDTQQRRHLRACFEVLVRDTSRVYWGTTAKAYRSGHPWDIYSSSHFTSAKEVYTKLHDEVADDFDWKWKTLEEIPDDPSYQRVKDLGVDVVTWRPWLDKRGGQHYLLIQCATTEKGVLSKSDDINKHRLGEFMRIPCTGFARAIATPSCILNHSAIRSLSRRAGLVFDRSRIVKITQSEAWSRMSFTSKDECISLISELMPN